MDYQGTIIRPPSEANSIILQVAVGCPYNKCTFCGTYKEETFKVKEQSTIDADIDFASMFCQRQKRVFLAGGDVLAFSFKRLESLFNLISAKLPWVNRISLYGSAKSIHAKSSDQLNKLKKLGLDRVYMGLESGHDPTLEAIKKGSNAKLMVNAGEKIRRAGIFLSVTVLLGIAGTKQSLAHAAATGKTLSQMAPNQIAALTLMVLPNTPLFSEMEKGSFELPDATGMLKELRVLIENITLEKVQFQSNHASNYLPINCRLSKDKQKVLGAIDRAVNGEISLVPEALRAL